MGAREAFAAEGAAHTGLLALQEWASKFHPLVRLEHRRGAEIACGLASVTVGQCRLIVVVDGKSTTIGPTKWKHSAAAAWLALVAHHHGLEAAEDAAHALGLRGTPSSGLAAWRNHWYSHANMRKPAGHGSPLWDSAPTEQGGTLWSISPRYLSAYLACFAAVGIEGWEGDEEIVCKWEAAQRRAEGGAP